MVIAAVLQYIPHVIAAIVLGAIALIGWRRTRATGALLIAISAAVEIVHYGMWIFVMQAMYRRGASYASWGWLSAMLGAGGLVGVVLFIVGVALLIKRLPDARRYAPSKNSSIVE
jgi:hypothetical protein